MKKLISKISIMFLLALGCLVMPVIESEAAEGTMEISDSAAAVGEIATVTIKVNADGAELGDCEVTLGYDTEMLEFVEGTYAEAADDGVWIAQYGTGTETEFTFELQFRVLEEGSSTITLDDFTAYLFSDERLYLQATGGEISSEEVNTVVGNPVELDGTSYYFYEDFSEALILEGFSKSTMEYDGYTHNVIVQDLTGRTAAYFVEGENDPVLVMYDETTASFIPAELVSVGSGYFLILLGNGDGSNLSSDFAETTLDINGTVFPAWQNMQETDYFLIYALSSEGFEGFYQYDSREGTYQRFIQSTPGSTTEESRYNNIILDKLNEIMNSYFAYILAGILIIILVMLIIIMVMSSIIGKRNAEIDDLYDELENGGQSLPEDDSEEDEEYDFDDEDDDDEYDFDDEFEDEAEYDFEDEYEDSEEYNYDDDEFDFDDEEEEEYIKPQRTKYALKKKAVSKDTYDYSVDFIDL